MAGSSAAVADRRSHDEEHTGIVERSEAALHVVLGPERKPPDGLFDEVDPAVEPSTAGCLLHAERDRSCERAVDLREVEEHPDLHRVGREVHGCETYLALCS
jgi:hypothetical protein